MYAAGSRTKMRPREAWTGKRKDGVKMWFEGSLAVTRLADVYICNCVPLCMCGIYVCHVNLGKAV